MNTTTIDTANENVVHGKFRPVQPANPVARIWTALKSWQSRRTAIRELSAMPDALLRDIGIERYQIKNAVNKGAASGFSSGGFCVHPAVIRLPESPAVAETRKAA